MGSKASAPAAPDPTQLTQAMATAADQTAGFNKSLNANNTSNPLGNLQYINSGTATNPQWSSQQNLNPALSAQLAGGVNQGVGNMQTSLNPQTMGNPAIQQDVNSQFGAQMGLLQPTFGIQQQNLTQQLANQGLQPGSAAYNNAENLLNQQQNNAYTQVANNAEQTGIGLQNQLFGQGLQAGQFGNTANLQQQGLNINAQQTPLNEYLALNSGAQMSQPQAQTPNVLGANQLQQQNLLNAYNAQVGGQNSMTSGLFGLGSTGLMAYLMGGGGGAAAGGSGIAAGASDLLPLAAMA